jgi:hypothetical protein
MEFKGTKGKWEVFSHESNGLIERTDAFAVDCTDYYEETLAICAVWRDFGEYEEAKANALLISKAPEMLEMLKKAERTLREVYECENEEIKQLIKEATEL